MIFSGEGQVTRVNKELRKNEFIPKKESQAPSYSKSYGTKPAAEKDVLVEDLESKRATSILKEEHYQIASF